MAKLRKAGRPAGRARSSRPPAWVWQSQQRRARAAAPAGGWTAPLSSWDGSTMVRGCKWNVCKTHLVLKFTRRCLSQARNLFFNDTHTPNAAVRVGGWAQEPAWLQTPLQFPPCLTNGRFYWMERLTNVHVSVVIPDQISAFRRSPLTMSGSLWVLWSNYTWILHRSCRQREEESICWTQLPSEWERTLPVKTWSAPYINTHDFQVVLQVWKQMEANCLLILMYQHRTVILHHHSMSLVAKYFSKNQEAELFALFFFGYVKPIW